MGNRKVSLKIIVSSQYLRFPGRFQMYDYDSCGWMDYVCPASNTSNMAKYNQTTPPEYNLSAVTTPNIIYYSKTDTISLPKVGTTKQYYKR